MAKGKGKVARFALGGPGGSGDIIGSVTIKKVGDREGQKPGNGGPTSKRLNSLAIDGGGTDAGAWIPRHNRIIGTGQV